MPRIFWAIPAATLAAWLSMNLWTVPGIEETAGGLRLLDMRFTGYSYEEAQEFVSALGDEGTALYPGAQYWLDMVFPPLLGAVIFLYFRWLLRGLPGLVTCIALRRGRRWSADAQRPTPDPHGFSAVLSRCQRLQPNGPEQQVVARGYAAVCAAFHGMVTSADQARPIQSPGAVLVADIVFWHAIDPRQRRVRE